MKESGIEWLGKIPAHWEVRKIKNCLQERSEKGYPNEPILCATQSRGVIPQDMYDNRVVVVNKDFDKLKLVKCGDFVISLRSFQGGIEYAYYQGIISAAYTILTPRINVIVNISSIYLNRMILFSCYKRVLQVFEKDRISIMQC